jgi:hypothetical protein
MADWLKAGFPLGGILRTERNFSLSCDFSAFYQDIYAFYAEINKCHLCHGIYSVTLYCNEFNFINVSRN